jgi:hypothetical protein
MNHYIHKDTDIPQKLQVIDLSHNKIVHLNERMFRNLPNLKQLYLDHNKIRTVRGNIFTEGGAKLKTLSLIGNPFECGCPVKWLAEMVDEGTEVWGSCAFLPRDAKWPMAIGERKVYELGKCNMN